MKFYEASKKDISTKKREEWKRHLKEFYVVPLDATQLRDGLFVGYHLNLPYDLSCNCEHLGDLLGPTEHHRHVIQLK